MKVVNFETYKSILPLQIIKPENSSHVANYGRSFVEATEGTQRFLSIHFIYSSTMAEHVQSPLSIAAGLAKFGGILAALRGLMIVMYWINRRQFEKKLTKFLQ